MKKQFKITIAFFMLAAMIGSAFAQTATKPAAGLTAEEIIKKSVEATNPKAAADKIKSRVTKGTVSVPAQGINGTIETYAKWQNKSYSIANLTGIGEFLEGYDGQVAWGKNPLTGLREKSGAELAVVKRDADLNAMANWKTYFTKAEVTGSEKVGDADTYMVKFTKGEETPVTVYFDKKTFYVLRTDLTQETPQGTFPVTVYESDYRDVDGVKLAFASKQEAAGATFEGKITEIKHNVPIEDSKFTKPAN